MCLWLFNYCKVKPTLENSEVILKRKKKTKQNKRLSKITKKSHSLNIYFVVVVVVNIYKKIVHQFFFLSLFCSIFIIIYLSFDVVVVVVKFNFILIRNASNYFHSI